MVLFCAPGQWFQKKGGFLMNGGNDEEDDDDDVDHNNSGSRRNLFCALPQQQPLHQQQPRGILSRGGAKKDNNNNNNGNVSFASSSAASSSQSSMGSSSSSSSPLSSPNHSSHSNNNNRKTVTLPPPDGNEEEGKNAEAKATAAVAVETTTSSHQNSGKEGKRANKNEAVEVVEAPAAVRLFDDTPLKMSLAMIVAANVAGWLFSCCAILVAVAMGNAGSTSTAAVAAELVHLDLIRFGVAGCLSTLPGWFYNSNSANLRRVRISGIAVCLYSVLRAADSFIQTTTTTTATVLTSSSSSSSHWTDMTLCWALSCACGMLALLPHTLGSTSSSSSSTRSSPTLALCAGTSFVVVGLAHLVSTMDWSLSLSFLPSLQQRDLMTAKFFMEAGADHQYQGEQCRVCLFLSNLSEIFFGMIPQALVGDVLVGLGIFVMNAPALFEERTNDSSSLPSKKMKKTSSCFCGGGLLRGITAARRVLLALAGPLAVLGAVQFAPTADLLRLPQRLVAASTAELQQPPKRSTLTVPFVGLLRQQGNKPWRFKFGMRNNNRKKKTVKYRDNNNNNRRQRGAGLEAVQNKNATTLVATPPTWEQMNRWVNETLISGGRAVVTAMASSGEEIYQRIGETLSNSAMTAMTAMTAITSVSCEWIAETYSNATTAMTAGWEPTYRSINETVSSTLLAATATRDQASRWIVETVSSAATAVASTLGQIYLRVGEMISSATIATSATWEQMHRRIIAGAFSNATTTTTTTGSS